MQQQFKLDENFQLQVLYKFAQLKFVNVLYSSRLYKQDNCHLAKLSFELEQVQKVGITGEYEKGKNCFINLLERIYEVSSGDIQFDEFSIKSFDLNNLRRIIGYVGKSPVLIDGSIKENIIFHRGLTHTYRNKDQIEKVCRDVLLMESIENLNKNLENNINLP